MVNLQFHNDRNTSNPGLVTPARFRHASEHCWFDNISDALPQRGGVSVENASLLSIIGKGYTFGNKTIFREIKRLPWMTQLEEDGAVTCLDIPPHGFLHMPPEKIAAQLFSLLLDEAKVLIADHREVVILLSGGLDSRIVALVVSELLRRREISCAVRCVTWGVPNCRDVEYARTTAKLLGFEWEHLKLGAEHLLENITVAAEELGASIYPTHLHRMIWSKKLRPECLVLAGSYGDSIGRAEYSGLHLLEVGRLYADDEFSLLKSTILVEAQEELKNEIAAFHRTNRADHVLREHEMLGIYMQNGLSGAMGVIGKYCDFGQMFTDPSVYGFMWSIHPAYRTDTIYASMLRMYGREVSAVPWARTNRALQGVTLHSINGLAKDFHQYRLWASTDLSDEIRKMVDPDWFAETGVFNPQKIMELRESVLSSSQGLLRPVEIITWLATFRKFVDGVRHSGRTVEFDRRYTLTTASGITGGKTVLCRKLRNIRFAISAFFPRVVPLLLYLRTGGRRLRRFLLRMQSIISYPPVRAAMKGRSKNILS